MQDKIFWVTVWQGGLFGPTKVLDEGFVWFQWYDPSDQAPQFVFHGYWCSGGYHKGVWDEKDNFGPNGRFDPRWCSWDAYYKSEAVEPWPYDDFTGYYFKPSDVVIGTIERTDEEEDLLFYGESVRW